MAFVQNSKMGTLQAKPSQQYGLHILDGDIFYYFEETNSTGTLERLRKTLMAKRLMMDKDGSLKEVKILTLDAAKKAKLTLQPIYLSKLEKENSQLNEPKTEKVSW